MIRKSLPLIMVAVLLVVLPGYKEKTRSLKQPTQYELTIKKIDNVWRVVDTKNNAHIMVNKGAKITWRAEGSDVVFQFPREVAKYFKAETSDDSLSDGYTKFLKDKKKLKLKVKDDAPPDTVEYAVFVKKDGVFAKGESPPRIIIR